MLKNKIYREIWEQEADFRVKYSFYTHEEGGRKHLPYQGIRSDFWYENDNHSMEGIFMIWPEFEDENIISHGEVLKSSTATMWIVSPQMRRYHQERIKVGTKGYFMEGSRRTIL